MNNIYDDSAFFEGYKNKEGSHLSYNELVEIPKVKRLTSTLLGITIFNLGG
uniref:hypothetical protein n=1 Tax=Staphylococcus sp. LKG8-2 TaxID=3399689 RepID=UPI003BF51A52